MNLAENVHAKSVGFIWVFAADLTFPSFSGSFRVHWLAYPVATGKNAGDDAARKIRRATRNTGGLRAAGHLAGLLAEHLAVPLET